MSICFEDVWFRYSGTKNYILKAISLEINDSGAIGILGTNGCGKSTFLKLLGGIVSPSLGRIRYDKQSIKEKKKQERIIYVPENARLFLVGPTPKKDLSHIISDPGYLDKLFEKHNLMHLADKKIYNLSEGQRRLIAIFNAFQIPSQLILLDEPTIGLDVKGRDLLFYLFSQAKKHGKVIVVASNDPRIFPRFDELVVIQQGTIFQRGHPKDVLYRLEDHTELIPNQIPRLIRSIEVQLGRSLPHCLTSTEMNYILKEEKQL